MFKEKKFLILFLVMVFILSISAVSASDIDNNNADNNILKINTDSNNPTVLINTPVMNTFKFLGSLTDVYNIDKDNLLTFVTNEDESLELDASHFGSGDYVSPWGGATYHD